MALLRPSRALLAALTTSLLLGACGGGGGPDAPPPPPPPPAFEVTATTPAQDEAGIAPDAAIATITLSHPASVATALPTAAVASVAGTPAPTVVTWSGDRTSVEVVVGGVLSPSAQVVIDLVGILRESDGLALDAGAALPLRFTLEAGEIEVPPAPTDAGRWLPASALLLDGRLLVTGGLGQDGVVRGDAVLVNDLGSTLGGLGAMGTARWAHAAGRLGDGRVLVAGGYVDGTGATPTSSSELFDPATSTFVAGPTMAVARGGATLVRTTDGLLVVVGGRAAHGGLPASATIEAYDDARERFVTLTGTGAVPPPVGLPVAVAEPAAAALPEGAFIVAGGVDATGVVLDAAYVFVPEDVTTRTTVVGGLVTPRRGATAVLAPTGEVFVFGGFDGAGAPLASIERYDPVTLLFEQLPTLMPQARGHVQVAVLPNGAIAVVGGVIDGAGTTTASLDVFDPSTRSILASHLLARPYAGGALFATSSGGLVIAEGATVAAVPPTARTGVTVLGSSALGAAVLAPKVLSFTPAAGIVGVDVDSTIVVKFSKPIAEASLVGGLVVTDAEQEPVAGTYVLASDRVTLTFTPDQPLPVLQKMGIEVKTTVTDLLGTALVGDGTRLSNFTTGYDLMVGAADDGSQFGFAVCSGDVNGDGIDDMVVSAYVAEVTPGSNIKPGQVYVIFGRSDIGPASGPIVRDLSSAASAADLTISFETDIDQPGIESALQVGDLDNDGYDDVIVGAHNGDGPGELNGNMGELFVIFGQNAFPSATLQLGKVSVPGFDILRVYGAATNERFGEGMALGDVDDDGYLDLLVGARFVTVTGGTNVGAVYCIFGGSKATLGLSGGFATDRVGSATTALANLRILGTDASDNLGWSAACGDMDGDGYAEIICGSTGGDGAGNTASSSGEAIVVFGAARSTLIPSGLFAEYRAGPTMALPAFVVYGDDAGDFFAWSLDCSDFDGDGYADLGGGSLLAKGQANTGGGRGEVNVLFGAPRATFLPGGATWMAYDQGALLNPMRALRIYGEATGHSFGDCTKFADVDGDGTKDIVIGDYQARGPLDLIGANVGELSILRGAGLIPNALTEIVMTSNGSGLPADVTVTRFYGKAKVVRFGTTIAVGDFNDDGKPDLMTGANQAKGLGRLFTDGGEAYVFWGRTTWWR